MLSLQKLLFHLLLDGSLVPSIVIAVQVLFEFHVDDDASVTPIEGLTKVEQDYYKDDTEKETDKVVVVMLVPSIIGSVVLIGQVADYPTRNTCTTC